MSEKPKLSVHIDRALKSTIESHAESKGKSVSAFVRDTMREHIYNRKLEQSKTETDAERRLLELVNEGKIELREIIEGIEDPIEQTALYSIALWELKKDEYSPAERRQAMETARRKVGLDDESSPTQAPPSSKYGDDDPDDDQPEVTVGEIDLDKEWSAGLDEEHE